MGMMLKPRYIRRNGWEKDLFDQKKSTDESVKDQGDVGCVFLIGKALSVMNMYHVVRWYKKTVLPGSFSAFEGCCAQEEA